MSTIDLDPQEWFLQSSPYLEPSWSRLFIISNEKLKGTKLGSLNPFKWNNLGTVFLLYLPNRVNQFNWAILEHLGDVEQERFKNVHCLRVFTDNDKARGRNRY